MRFVELTRYVSPRRLRLVNRTYRENAYIYGKRIGTEKTHRYRENAYVHERRIRTGKTRTYRENVYQNDEGIYARKAFLHLLLMPSFLVLPAYVIANVFLSRLRR